jgi:hypothetical protein
MIALAIQYLVATACLLFVVSLPLGKSQVGVGLRRIAASLFLLAFMPSLFFGLIRGGSHGARASGPLHEIGCAIVGLLLVLVSSAVAYAFLEIRKRIGRPSKDAWSEYINLRSTGKTSVRSPKQSRRHGISPLMDQNDDD